LAPQAAKFGLESLAFGLSAAGDDETGAVLGEGDGGAVIKTTGFSMALRGDRPEMGGRFGHSNLRTIVSHEANARG
jgi:hypothetical protein